MSVYTCICVCVCLYIHIYLCVYISVSIYLTIHICIYRGACNARMGTLAFLLVVGRSPASAAGVTWKRLIRSAPWDARYYHSTVIDAAGAIYVLGGYNGGTFTHYKDVWMCTPGGA